MATIMGTAQADVLAGTYGDDIIYGFSGDDTLTKTDGRDIVYGGFGQDRLEFREVETGGQGDDKSTEIATRSTIYGGSGDDALSGVAGFYDLYGGDGDDRLSASITNRYDESYIIDAGSGNDRILAVSGRPEIWGGSGDDGFILDFSSTTSMIMDLEAEEKIVLLDPLGSIYLNSNADGDAVLVSEGQSVSLTLKNISADRVYLSEQFEESAIYSVIPAAIDHRLIMFEDSSLTVDLLDSDLEDAGAYAWSITSVAGANNGTVMLNEDGTVTYRPDENFFGVDSFTYTVTGEHGGTDTASVRVNVSAVADAPTASGDSGNTDEDTPLTLDLLRNDRDVDGDKLSIAVLGKASNGEVVQNDDGTVTYTPNAEFIGIDSFSYAISDGNGGTDVASVIVGVAPVNDAPTAEDDEGSTAENRALTLDLLRNDRDVDGDRLSIVDLGEASNGSVVLNDDGTITYTPNADFFGDDNFQYTISDSAGGMDTAKVSVRVVAVNHTPTATDDEGSTDKNTSLTLDLLGNDRDGEDDELDVSELGKPSNGTVERNDDGTVTYTPNEGFVGDDKFEYTISDRNGGEATANVSVSVNDIDDSVDDDDSGSDWGEYLYWIALLAGISYALGAG